MKNVFYNSWVAKTVLCLSKCHTIMLFGFVFSELKQEEVTQMHLANIVTLTSVEEVKNYDYLSGYPKKLSF